MYKLVITKYEEYTSEELARFEDRRRSKGYPTKEIDAEEKPLEIAMKETRQLFAVVSEAEFAAIKKAVLEVM